MTLAAATPTADVECRITIPPTLPQSHPVGGMVVNHRRLLIYRSAADGCS
jgi:hypothetical protein